MDTTDQLEVSERVATLSALASAIAGEALHVVSAPAGQASSCDGAVLQLDLSLPSEALRQTCIAQALLVAAASLRVSGVHRLVGRPQAAQRYFALELQRAVSMHQERVPHRFEHALTSLWSGSATRSAEDSLARALDARAPVPSLPVHFGVLRPARLVTARIQGKGLRNSDRHARRSGAVEQHSEDDELDDSAGRLLRIFSTPLSGSALSDWVSKLLGFGRSPSGSGEQASKQATTVPRSRSQARSSQRAHLVRTRSVSRRPSS